jgi:hypothetical protein
MSIKRCLKVIQTLEGKNWDCTNDALEWGFGYGSYGNTIYKDLDFVHLKDMRASGFEPVDVISHYKYQDGLGFIIKARKT